MVKNACALSNNIIHFSKENRFLNTHMLTILKNDLKEQIGAAFTSVRPCLSFYLSKILKIVFSAEFVHVYKKIYVIYKKFYSIIVSSSFRFLLLMFLDFKLNDFAGI